MYKTNVQEHVHSWYIIVGHDPIFARKNMFVQTRGSSLKGLPGALPTYKCRGVGPAVTSAKQGGTRAFQNLSRLSLFSMSLSFQHLAVLTTARGPQLSPPTWQGQQGAAVSWLVDPACKAAGFAS